MTQKQALGDLRMIPIDRIEVLNPRDRNKQVFEQIVENIKSVGLKKPITVTPRPGDDGEEKYLLVCGEGRLKAFMALGETTIAALVVDVSEEDAFIMSMVENIARRKSSPLELLAGIQQLVAKGYDKKTIACLNNFPRLLSGLRAGCKRCRVVHGCGGRLRRTDRRGGQLGAHQELHFTQPLPVWAANPDRPARA